MGCRTRKQAQWQSATRSLWMVVSSTLMALSGSVQHVAMNGVSNARKCDSTDRITHQSAAQAEPLTAIGSTGPKGHQPALDSHPPQMTIPRLGRANPAGRQAIPGGISDALTNDLFRWRAPNAT